LETVSIITDIIVALCSIISLLLIIRGFSIWKEEFKYRETYTLLKQLYDTIIAIEQSVYDFRSEPFIVEIITALHSRNLIPYLQTEINDEQRKLGKTLVHIDKFESLNFRQKGHDFSLLRSKQNYEQQTT